MEAPENTAQSFLHSVKNGVDVIETDVRMTADKVIIPCHDATFERLCDRSSLTNRNQTVGETKFNDLPAFKQEMPVHFGNKVVFARGADDQNGFSTLDDVFSLIPTDQLV